MTHFSRKIEVLAAGWMDGGVLGNTFSVGRERCTFFAIIAVVVVVAAVVAFRPHVRIARRTLKNMGSACLYKAFSTCAILWMDAIPPPALSEVVR